ncbi:hypothetical protein [Massilia sp. TWR1-2-2]|uniref:hypothetical protein n=1 Tax=Massilia sp. TWR1-2-2 TaxID=2804584 RepID=UPI003CEA96B0
MKTTFRRAVILVGGVIWIAIFARMLRTYATEIPVAARVESLVVSVTRDARTEQESFLSLMSMGDVAAPFIVGHLGDMRPNPPKLAFNVQLDGLFST